MNATGIVTTSLLLLYAATTLSAGNVSLDGEWKLDFWEQGRTPVLSPEGMKGIDFETVSAAVPGNVELDLLAAGLIENPETGSNVYLLRPYEGYQWKYSRHFTTPSRADEDDIILHFGGVDCYAEVWLNGKHIGSCDNMLIEHDFNISQEASPQNEDNLLEVIIRSSVIEGRRHIPPTISFNFAQIESIYSRRAPHTYGWDIMPRLVSAGLWRSVSVEVMSPVHILDTHWFTTSVDINNRNATVFLDYTVNLPVKYQDGKMCAKIILSKDGKEIFSKSNKITSHAARQIMELHNVDFWWPRGYGDPSLYDAALMIIDEYGNVVDSDTKSIGIRTVKLDMTPMNTEENPGRFCFIVNDEKIYIRGSNWTPMDAFHSRDPQHLEEAFEIAKDLNCNMLRCWGGNVYEDHAFFDLCDQNGIMVWQDFAMGCTQYPQDPDFQKAIADEVRSVTIKLRSHPSLALWSGNNEDDDNLTVGTLSVFGLDPNDDVVSRVTIPSVLFETDPARPYLPSSPYWSKELMATSRNGNHLPEMHLWGPRGYYKDSFYTEAKCIFASEIGYHGMPDRKSLEKMFPPESVYPWSDAKEFRWNEDWLTKSVRIFKESGYTPDRNNLMLNQVRLLFGEVPTNLDKFILASQSVQAEAMKFFIERFRGHKFEPNTGMLWWNIRDGWPLISDAVVDWYNSPKLAYSFIKESQTDVCALINDPEDGALPLIVVNDTREDVSGKVSVEDVRTGKTVFKGNYEVDANGKTVVTAIQEPSGQGLFKIAYTGKNGEKLENHYLYGKAPFNLDDYINLQIKAGIHSFSDK